MSSAVAEVERGPDGLIAMHQHRCRACSSPWCSTHRVEAECPFCGSADLAPSVVDGGEDPEPGPEPERAPPPDPRPRRSPGKVRTDAPREPKQRRRRKPANPADVSEAQRRFRERVDRMGR